MAPASFSMVPSGSAAVAGAAWAATCAHSRTILRCTRAVLRLKVLCPRQLVQAAVLPLALFPRLYVYRQRVLQRAQGRSKGVALLPVCGREHCAKPLQPAQAAVKPQAARGLAWYQTGIWSCSVLGFGGRELGLRALRLRPHASISVCADSQKTGYGPVC